MVGNIEIDIDGEMAGAVTALLSVTDASPVAEDTTHHLCGGVVELETAVEIDGVLLDEAEIGFVDEGCWLERVPSALPGEIAGGKTAKFCIDEGDEGRQGSGVTSAPATEELGDGVVGLRHSPSICRIVN